MTNEKIKETLLSIEDCAIDFSVTQSGKKSKKVHGLYKPATREIIIHNKNFEKDGRLNENLLLYTAIHEYAHHIHASRHDGALPLRAHTSEFWSIFHELLDSAEAKNLYADQFASSPELQSLTKEIREHYLKTSGELLRKFGELLMQALSICEKEGLRFEDYVDRALCIPRAASKTAMKAHNFSINTEIGSDNMKYLAGISNNEARGAAENALLEGKSPDLVKNMLKKRSSGADFDENNDDYKKSQLEKEKKRLVRTIEQLESRLKAVEKELADGDA